MVYELPPDEKSPERKTLPSIILDNILNVVFIFLAIVVMLAGIGIAGYALFALGYLVIHDLFWGRIILGILMVMIVIIIVSILQYQRQERKLQE